MDLEKIFKNIIILEVVYFISAICYGMYLGSDINFLGSDINTEEDISFNISEKLFFLWLLIYFINLYFLFKFKPIGKKLYVPLIIIWYILFLGFPESYLTYGSHFESLLDSVDIMIHGIIIAMIYWTDIKKKFES